MQYVSSVLKKKNIPIVILLGMYLVLIVKDIVLLSGKPLKYASLEWLVSFDESLRRGLMGSFLKMIAQWGINPIYVIHFICIFCIVALGILLLKKTRLNFSPFWLISPFYLGYTIVTESYARKDMLILLVLIIVMELLEKPSLMRKIASVLLIVIGVYIHEIFVLLSFFPFLAFLLQSKKDWVFRLWPMIVLFFAIFSLLIFNYHHNSFTDWNVILPTFDPNYTVALDYGPFLYVGLTLQDKIRIIGEYPIPLLYFVVYYLVLIFLTLHLGVKKKLDNLLISLILQSLSLFPLFFIAVDYGRWINLIVLSAIWMASLNYKFTFRSSNKVKSLIKPFEKKKIGIKNQWILLGGFAITPCLIHLLPKSFDSFARHTLVGKVFTYFQYFF